MPLVWNRARTDAALHPLLETLAEEYPLAEGGDGAPVTFERVDDADALAVEARGGGWHVRYGRPASAARGLGYALAGRAAAEHRPFDTFGALLDCSRTGMVTVAHFKRWLRRLALFGYNQAMLYTKDGYVLEGEPYFGRMRGGYTHDELRAIDDYAARLGVEMVASIQALGHLEPILRWPAYDAVKDTDNVLLVDDPRSYALIDKMLAFWAGAFRSRRIHLGMDETHDLGRGRFLDRHGYERGFDLYNRHLRRVCDRCAEQGLAPMIWSDMYFRLGNARQDYYDPATVIPGDVRDAIAPDAQLVYWDYYHRDAAFYTDWIARHRALGKEPVVASGIWTWCRTWYDHAQTVATAGPCLDACRAAGVREITFTMWGDDGGYCEFDSAFAGLAWAADRAGNDRTDEARVGELFGAVASADYARQLAASALDYRRDDGEIIDAVAIFAGPALWDDPLMGLVWREAETFGPAVWAKAGAHWRRLADTLAPHRDDGAAGRLDHAWRLADLLARKTAFRLELLRAHGDGDRAALARLAREDVPAVTEAIEELLASFRALWRRSYKPFGLEIVQIRLAGLAERYREVARRVVEDGAFPELDDRSAACGEPPSHYRFIATGGWFI